MADDASKKRLGRGLAALIGEMDKPVAPLGTMAASETPAVRVADDRTVPIESIRRNPNNPRRIFSDHELDELSRSIKEHGIVQPILVRGVDDSSGDQAAWEIIAGERRWRAAQRAGLDNVPIIIRDVDDRQALELAIIENVQRADLNPVEEAQGYQQLMDQYQYKQADLGDVIGKSRSHVANTLRLLRLPEAVLSMVSSGSLSAGHARALIPLSDPVPLAQRIVDEALSARDAERLAALAANPPSDLETKSAAGAPIADFQSDVEVLERKLSDVLGMKVAIKHRPNGKGRLMVDYRSLEQLDALEAKLSN
ncbi:MAG: ParB/RepB/Spo0J family partition protein [Pseudomonadota bacterium]